MAKIQPKSFGGAPDKKIFQRFDFIKKSIPQKQNIFKLFLIAVFCLGSLGAARAGDVKILNEKQFLKIVK